MLLEQALEEFKEQLKNKEQLLVYHKDQVELTKQEIDELQNSIGELSKIIK